MKKIVILGATSGIAEASGKLFAEAGWEIVLAGRSEEKLSVVKKDYESRGAKVSLLVGDLADIEAQKGMFQQAQEGSDKIDAVLLAYGILGSQEEGEEDFSEARKVFKTNFISAASWLTLFSNLMQKQGEGVIGVISSVAGDRGRKSNYIYGTSKGALSLWLEGLRNRLFKSGVRVVDIRPGFIDTAMTADLKKNFLYAAPEKAGKDIFKAMTTRGDVIYTPFFWRFIMLIIIHMPRFIFKRLGL